jgi:pilus assembly protein CpaE
MTPVGHRLFVLSSEEPLRDDLEITAEAVDTLVGALREQFHYVIVDVPRIPATPYWQALSIADFRIIVGDQTLRSVRDIVRLRSMLGEGDGKQRDGFVVNRYGEGGRHAVTLKEMQHVLGLQPMTVISFVPTVLAAATNGMRVAAARRGKFTDAIAALVLELSGRPPERRRWWSTAR